MDREKLAYDLALIYAKEKFRKRLESSGIHAAVTNTSAAGLKGLFEEAYNFYNKPEESGVKSDDVGMDEIPIP